MLKKYAELLIKKGVNLQVDQELVITGSVECVELMREIASQAYSVGAKNVIVHYIDEKITHMRYMHNDVSFFEEVPSYIVELKNAYALKHAAVLSLTSEDPEGFKDVDANKVATYSKAMHIACKTFYDHLDLGIDRWCIAGAASIAWANKVFPDMSDAEALETLNQVIYKVCYCDREDPCKTWDEHRRSFEKRVKILNDMDILFLHYTNGLGTDLTLGMNKDYLFAGGGSYTRDGIYSFPNIPTEEIFCSPDYKKTEGIVYSSLPLNYNGTLVKDISLVFKEGRIVECHALEGEEVLKHIINTDEGSHYLGEMALVPYDSQISRTGILFYNTLFDENASCHLAIGKGFSECIKNGLDMDKKELYNHGINDSLTHVDFMIGTSDLSIEATCADGTVKPIFKNGNYVI